MTIKEIKKLLKDFKPEATGNKWLDNRYDPNSRYYRFFYQLVKKFKPKTIVELGSWQGTSAAHFAGGCKETKVITVDHHTDPGDRENMALTIDAALEFRNMVYCRGWTCEEIYNEERYKHALGQGQNAFPKVMKELNGETIDVLFIDSWHHDYQAWRDWNAYSPHLSKGALVIVDDVTQGSPEGGIFNILEGFWKKLEGIKHLDDSLHEGYPVGFLIV